MILNSVFQCKVCENKDYFIAEYTLSGECIVTGTGDEVEGIESPVSGELAKYCDTSWSTRTEKPYKCAVCGSNNLGELILKAKIDSRNFLTEKLVIEMGKRYKYNRWTGKTLCLPFEGVLIGIHKSYDTNKYLLVFDLGEVKDELFNTMISDVEEVDIEK